MKTMNTIPDGSLAQVYNMALRVVERLDDALETIDSLSAVAEGWSTELDASSPDVELARKVLKMLARAEAKLGSAAVILEDGARDAIGSALNDRNPELL